MGFGGQRPTRVPLFTPWKGLHLAWTLEHRQWMTENQNSWNRTNRDSRCLGLGDIKECGENPTRQWSQHTNNEQLGDMMALVKNFQLVGVRNESSICSPLRLMDATYQCLRNSCTPSRLARGMCSFSTMPSINHILLKKLFWNLATASNAFGL